MNINDILTTNTFSYAHVDAMYDGLSAGFMDVFFGIGKNFIETNHVNFFAKWELVQLEEEYFLKVV